jgi:hypothetical protein
MADINKNRKHFMIFDNSYNNSVRLVRFRPPRGERLSL